MMLKFFFFFPSLTFIENKRDHLIPFFLISLHVNYFIPCLLTPLSYPNSILEIQRIGRQKWSFKYRSTQPKFMQHKTDKNIFKRGNLLPTKFGSQIQVLVPT